MGEQVLAEAIEVVVELLDYGVQPLRCTVGRAVMGRARGVEAADGAVGGSKCSGF